MRETFLVSATLKKLIIQEQEGPLPFRSHHKVSSFIFCRRLRDKNESRASVKYCAKDLKEHFSESSGRIRFCAIEFERKNRNHGDAATEFRGLVRFSASCQWLESSSW
eukprot:scaffold8374_cov175-Amphora_coffeaeformis.AAC.47